MKPPKGHKFDNERSQRADEIVKKLEEMPKLIQEYRDVRIIIMIIYLYVFICIYRNIMKHIKKLVC